jgi:long-chain acyl-CoA synthetase
MAEHGWRNLVVMFFQQAERFGERPFLWYRSAGHYQPLTWREVAAQVCALARGLKALDVRQGDRVVIVSENRPEWLIADLAIMTAGGVTVPAYTTNSEAEQRYLLENSGAVGAIVSSTRLGARLQAAGRGVPDFRFLIGIEPPVAEAGADVTYVAWSHALALGDGDHTNLLQHAQTIGPDDLACIIYTSGTGGTPKGVMLPHRAMLHNCRGGAEVLRAIPGGGDHVFLSFLPLSHAYEHTCGQFLPMAIGAEIYYAEGADKVAANLREARPTIVAAVPRFFELIQGRIRSEVRKAGGWRERVFLTALRLGAKRVHAGVGGLANPLEWLLDLIAGALVRPRLRQRFGGRLQALISGGAPLHPEVGLFFTALGLPVYQGYGQTEAGPLISVNRPGRARMHSVGEPLPEVELRITQDGEIVVRGPMLMLGYWRNEEATRDVLRDGWLHTGDIGALDADGQLRITDRKKDIIISSGGDNISPARVEALLCRQPEIGQAMVYGDRRPHLVAVIVPEPGWLKAWAETAGKPVDPQALAGDCDLAEALRRAVDETNSRLSLHERVRKIVIAPTPFSVENGTLTPTLKIRRHVIAGAYGAALEALYD